MSNPSSSPARTRASLVSAKIAAQNQNYVFSAVDVTTHHNSNELRFAARVFMFSPPPPTGGYSIDLYIPRGTPAGTHALGANSPISAFFGMPNAQLLNAYKAIRGTVTFATAPTEKKVEGTFNFVGESNDPSKPEPAIVTEGVLSIDIDDAPSTRSHGNLSMEVDIKDPPASNTSGATLTADKFTFNATSVSMSPAVEAPYLQIKAVDMNNRNAEVYLFIPDGKLESTTRLPIAENEDGEHALAVCHYQGRWMYGEKGQLTFKYNPATKNFNGVFDFYQGKNAFTQGTLNITGIDPA
ncbi:hypothetical protein [Pseudomonas palleroniana]